MVSLWNIKPDHPACDERECLVQFIIDYENKYSNFTEERLKEEIDDSLRLSERDAEIFIKMLNDPGQPNDALKKAA